MRDILEDLRRELARGGRICLATIVRQWGSAPRSVGTHCLVRPDGEILGTIGGGVLEADVIEAARRALNEGAAELHHFRLMGRDAAQSEMICGGDVDVYLEPLDPADQGGAGFLARSSEALARVAARGESALMATLVSPGAMPGLAGRRLLWTQGEGTIGAEDGPPEVWGELLSHIGELSQGFQPCLWPGARVLPGQEIFFLEPIFNRPVVYICGGGHISLCLAPLLKTVGFGVSVIDDRPEYANQRRFPMADEVWVRDFRRVFEGLAMGPLAYVVIVTRGHLYDKEVLAQALERPAAYVGMIGSRRKRDLIYQALERQGISPERLARVHSPIGLAIGAETPEEIAVSIVAELIAARAGRPRVAGPSLNELGSPKEL